MTDKPIIFFDPFPRNEEMVYTSDVEKELNEISNLTTHFGSRAPDDLIEENLPNVEIIVGQTSMPKERLDKAKKLKAIINVKCNWEPNIDYIEAHKKGIYVLSAAPAMAPAVAEACIGYAISLSRRTIQNYNQFLKSEEKYGIKGNKEAYTLFNSKVGFIGFGNLAKNLLPLLKPFNCNISVYDPWLSNQYLESQGVSSVSLDELFSIKDEQSLYLEENSLLKNQEKKLKDEINLLNEKITKLEEDNANMQKVSLVSSLNKKLDLSDSKMKKLEEKLTKVEINYRLSTKENNQLKKSLSFFEDEKKN